jgi:hypothetical protein
MSGKELATSKSSLVSSEEDLKALASSMGVEEGNEEHLSQDELEVPFLRIAQKGTSQVDEDSADFIEGLKPGHFFNTVTSETYGDEVMLQVHGYYRNFTVWKGAKGQGEYNGTMTPDEYTAFSETTDLERDGGDFVQIVDGEEIRYSDTRNFLVTLADSPEDGIMLYPMTSTGIKPAKKWNTMNRNRRINGKMAKRFATIWKLKTAGFEKNGFTWKQVSSIIAVGWANAELLEMAKSFEDFTNEVKNNSDKVKYSNDDNHNLEAEDSKY